LKQTIIRYQNLIYNSLQANLFYLFNNKIKSISPDILIEYPKKLKFILMTYFSGIESLKTCIKS